ncbi:MAG: BrnA antitoxin family protein [Geminicoccaceae bacterium]
MTGKSENIVSYTAEEVEAKRRRGEGRTNWAMGQEEAMRRRRADAEAPQPYQGWQDTVTLEPPQSKEQVTLRLDRDVLEWFRTKGRGYQTRINAVLRAYYLHERGKQP